LSYSREQEYLLPAGALARAIRARFAKSLKETYPQLAAAIDLSRASQDWVVHCKAAGRGRSALRYLAAYVKKSAFSESRLAGYDKYGRVRVRYKQSGAAHWKLEALDPKELIRRWLLHVLPKGLVRVRHYGWLSPAAGKAFARIRFLLGLRTPLRVRAFPQEPPRCPCCSSILIFAGRIAPIRGPPLSRVPR
jgi:Putative transposase